MKPNDWSMVGLAFDIFGAFFLSVEAIKVENFIKLRDRILLPVHKSTLSPEIVFVGDVAAEQRENKKARPDYLAIIKSYIFIVIYMGLHFVAGAIVLFLLLMLSSKCLSVFGISLPSLGIKANIWFSSRSGLFKVAFSIISAPLLGGLLFYLGELVHKSINILTKVPVLLVNYIYQKTPNGTIGILGFILLLIGFLFQFIGNYLAR